MVEQADAVAGPRAVMVHLHDAPAAKAAVMRSRRLHFVALLAVFEAIERVDIHGEDVGQILVLVLLD